jgi:hypothetical protein
MFVAFLFDPTPTGACDYGSYLRDRVFESGILQRARKTMLVRVGDVLFYNYGSANEIATRLETTNAWPGKLKRPLTEELGAHRVYAHAIRGIGKDTAIVLHEHLLNEDFYIGAIGVNRRNGAHYVLFQQMLLFRHLLCGDSCWTDFEEEVDELQELGFRDVRYVGNSLHRFVRWGYQDGSMPAN